MIDKLWDRFNKLHYLGSVATLTNKLNIIGVHSETEQQIYKAISKLDPDYTQACIIKRTALANSTLSQPISTIKVEGLSTEEILEKLEECVLDGLAHYKAFIIEESGDLVKFGYEHDDLLSQLPIIF